MVDPNVTNLLTMALDAITEGMYIVPCGLNKMPLTTHGVNDATTDVNVIRRWFKLMGARIACIAVNCGRSGLLVVDVDTAETEALIRRKYPHWLLTRRVRTGSGGLHLYFRLPANLEIKSNQRCFSELPKTDTRSRGGYAIFAGHNENGEYVAENPVAPAQIPDDLMRLIVANNLIWRPPEPLPDPVRRIPGGTMGPDYWVDKYTNEAAVGTRHKMAGRLALQLKADGLSESEARGHMARYARSVDCVNKPYTEKEALDSLRYVYANYQQLNPATRTDARSAVDLVLRRRRV